MSIRSYGIRIYISSVSVVTGTFLLGCSGAPRDRSEPVSRTPFLIATAQREYHFGFVIARPGKKLEHRYRLVNRSENNVRIITVVNRKPCCGTVELRDSNLRPGDQTYVDISLLVGEKFGNVVHEAELVTDVPAHANIVLRTTVEAIPALRIVDSPDDDRVVLVGTQKPRKIEFRVVAEGTRSEPPFDLDLVSLKSTVKAAWTSIKRPDRTPGYGFDATSRRFAVWLTADSGLGSHDAEVLLSDGKNVLYRHIVQWEVVAPISISPKILVLRQGDGVRRALIQSRDQKPFRIERIESNAAGVTGRPLNRAAAVTHTIEIEGIPPHNEPRGEITIFTDHPSQPKIQLHFVLLD